MKTRKLTHLGDNLAAADAKLTSADLRDIDRTDARLTLYLRRANRLQNRGTMCR